MYGIIFKIVTASLCLFLFHLLLQYQLLSFSSFSSSVSLWCIPLTFDAAILICSWIPNCFPLFVASVVLSCSVRLSYWSLWVFVSIPLSMVPMFCRVSPLEGLLPLSLWTCFLVFYPRKEGCLLHLDHHVGVAVEDFTLVFLSWVSYLTPRERVDTSAVTAIWMDYIYAVSVIVVFCACNCPVWIITLLPRCRWRLVTSPLTISQAS